MLCKFQVAIRVSYWWVQDHKVEQITQVNAISDVYQELNVGLSKAEWEITIYEPKWLTPSEADLPNCV